MTRSYLVITFSADILLLDLCSNRVLSIEAEKYLRLHETKYDASITKCTDI